MSTYSNSKKLTKIFDKLCHRKKSFDRKRYRRPLGIWYSEWGLCPEYTKTLVVQITFQIGDSLLTDNNSHRIGFLLSRQPRNKWFYEEPIRCNKLIRKINYPRLNF